MLLEQRMGMYCSLLKLGQKCDNIVTISQCAGFF